jgi:dTDP-4-amino-4,6-dideoxygalactose transaminase
MNLAVENIQRLITTRTKAVVAMHYAGVGCEMEELMDIAERHGLEVVEDNAHGLFGKYKGRQLGTFGRFSTQSFHETKNFSCGEGGALLINRREDIERAEIIREKGTNRSLFFRGQVDKYTWVDVGSSYLPSDMLAAFLLAQLEERVQIQAKRKLIWETYYEHLQSWAKSCGARLPIVPPYCEQSYHLFYLLLPSLGARQALIAHLRERGILSVFHYLPLHSSPMGRRFGGKEGDCPVTEDVSDRLLRLPFFYSLSSEEQQNVIEAVCSFDC